MYLFSEYLLRIFPRRSILRVYSGYYEETEFPIPNKLPKWRTFKEETQMSDKVKSVALHHVIRRDSPQAQKLKQIEQEFESIKKRGESIDEEEVANYCKVRYFVLTN